MLLEGVRREVAEGARELSAAGLVRGTSGNLSARAGDLVAVTPTGVGCRDLGPGQVTVVDLAGAVVAGALRPSSELPMHLAIYRARPDVGAVAHTHSVFATTFAVLGEELPAVHYLLAWAGRRVRVAPYATYGSADLARSCVEVLGRDGAVLLANHGVVAVGAGVAAALRVAEAVEQTAELCWRARAIGIPMVLPDQALDRVAAAFGAYGQPAEASAAAAAPDLASSAPGRAGQPEEAAMVERRAVVGSRIGLHMRVAAIFVRAAAGKPVKVTIAKDGKDAVDAASMLDLLRLDVRGGEEVVLAAAGDGAEQALDELVAVVEADHDAPASG
jgi:L-fuculose-phosphate aldolase